MKKQDIINQIKEILTTKFNIDGYYPFYNALTFHLEYSKFDLMGFCFNNNDELMVECIGYNSFNVYHIEAKKMAYNTLYKFKKYIESV